MDEEFIFKPAAFKHGILEADIRKAFEQRIFDHAMPGEEYKNLLIGLDRSGNPLEILYNVYMTDHEAEYWDDYYTKNTIMPDLNKPGHFALKYGMPVKLDTETGRAGAAHTKTAQTPHTAINS
ncbi:MAG: hypothetical protein LBK66_08430 [Spirochaetaceae bacterium]|jgi:hypothetical protein|nr:hypothetical protein [Spirochaetaceae bacterium]